MRCFCWMIGLLLFSSAAWLQAEDLFEVKPIAEGVYAAIAKPSFRTNSNSAIIMLDDGVLVVDSQSKPSATLAVIAEIKKLTDKPVKYVVLSHFHGDHVGGASAYRNVWPGVAIVSSEATRESLEKLGIPRMKREILMVPPEIDRLKSELEKTNDQRKKEQILTTIRQAEAYLAELKQMQLILPTMTIEKRVVLQNSSRTVELLWLGRGHTAGDLFVYLPKERVIATGDDLHAMVPNLRDAYPYEWVHTLDEAEKLDFDYVIPSHGPLLRGKATFDLWKEYISDVMAETANVFAEGGSLDEARKRVVPTLVAKYKGRFPDSFSRTVVTNVENAYRVVSAAFPSELGGPPS